ncbi:hypothetical protein ACFX2I_026143 [Malus domestica]
MSIFINDLAPLINASTAFSRDKVGGLSPCFQVSKDESWGLPAFYQPRLEGNSKTASDAAVHINISGSCILPYQATCEP